MYSRKRCAVVGAGASGLTTARWALAYGVEPVVFEKTSSTGGIWRYDAADTESAGVMATTTANTSKEMSAFSDFPPPDDAPVFMRNADMLRYLRAYADHHRLVDHIRFRHTVTLVERAGDYARTGRWLVHYRNDDIGTKHVETFDAVLICHGNQKPMRAGTERKNWEQFRGRIMHACEVKNVADFVGTTNVVVGFKPSATDIAVELSRVADKVYLSSRSGGFVLSRTSNNATKSRPGGGRPLDMSLMRHYRTYLLGRFNDRWLKRNFLANIDHETCGIARLSDPIFAKGITIIDDLTGRIACGAVVLRPDIAEYTPHGVRWTDGTAAKHVDNVIFASGYKFDTLLVEGGNVVPVDEWGFAHLYLNVYPPQLADWNTLGFICFQYVMGPLMPIFELMARGFFEQLAGGGASRLPGAQKMAELVDSERRGVHERAQKFHSSVRQQTIREWVSYADQLADLARCRPNIWRTIVKDPRLALALCFGPNVPYVYRLQGPHPWAGARDAILSAEGRVDRALARSPPRKVESGLPNWSSRREQTILPNGKYNN